MGEREGGEDVSERRRDLVGRQEGKKAQSVIASEVSLTKQRHHSLFMQMPSSSLTHSSTQVRVAHAAYMR